MNIDEIIADLRQELQRLEDTKTQITEAQENIRNMITQCELMKGVFNRE